MRDQLQESNRALRMLSACNEAMLRIKDERRLMGEVCRIAVRVGGYRMAWVGVPLYDEAKTVRPVASTGFEGGYLKSARISWGDNERGRGPTGRAVRLGFVQVADDFSKNKSLRPWRGEAQLRGFRSSIALPLRRAASVMGVLSIYSTKTRAFRGPQRLILIRLADDLAFGIASLRTQAQLRSSRLRLRRLASELTLAEQSERRRIASVLHDDLQQLLVGATLSLRPLTRAKHQTTRQAAETVENILSRVIARSRSLALELNPPLLLRGGLSGALAWLGRHMKEQHGLTVSVDAEDGLLTPSPDELTVLYQSARELLFNVVKHAGVSSARLEMREIRGGLRMSVSDRGAGFNASRLARGGGFGLASIRDRLELLGGALKIESAPGRGSRFTLSLPLSRPGTGRRLYQGEGL